MSNNFDKTKSHIIDYLYDKLEMSEYKYALVKNISDLFDLRNNKYYVSPNSCGINSFLVFTKNEKNFHSFYVDRRSISYNKQTLNKNSVRMKEINLPVNKELYNGTIFDGIWIDEELSSNNHNSGIKKKYFIVTDIYEFCGKKYITMDYFKKMAHFELYLNNYFDKTKSDIDIIIQRPYQINQIEKMFKEHIYVNYKKLNIKGISFYPMYSGSKLIYLFDKEDEKTKNELLSGIHKISNNQDNNNPTDDNYDSADKKKIYKFKPSNINSTNEIKLNFLLKKTRSPDVYNIYSIFLINNKYIYKKIDIAYVPSYNLSVKLRTLFLNKTKIICECKLDYDKNEWIPLNKSTINKIDVINQDERINIIEEFIQEE
jgi:hypothetical protein